MTKIETLEMESAPLEEPGEEVPVEKAPPIGSRFLFVDVAAMRAKQLRRGALPRVLEPSNKLERVAMREVEAGLIHYILPENGAPGPEAA